MMTRSKADATCGPTMVSSNSCSASKRSSIEGFVEVHLKRSFPKGFVIHVFISTHLKRSSSKGFVRFSISINFNPFEKIQKRGLAYMIFVFFFQQTQMLTQFFFTQFFTIISICKVTKHRSMEIW